MIETAFLNLLSTSTAITDLVGDEIYLTFNPDPTDLYVIAMEILHSRPANIDNTLSKQSARFQVDIFGRSSPAVSDVSVAIVGAMNFQGDNTQGHNIQVMRVDAERSGYETAAKVFRKSLDITIFFD